jgi:hypothetical protein
MRTKNSLALNALMTFEKIGTWKVFQQLIKSRWSQSGDGICPGKGSPSMKCVNVKLTEKTFVEKALTHAT